MREIIASGFILSVIFFATYVSADELPDCGNELSVKYNSLVSKLINISNAKVDYFPPAPPYYTFFCHGEPDFSKKDRIQEQNRKQYADIFLDGEKSFFSDLSNAGSKMVSCGMAENETFLPVLKIGSKMITGRMTASIEHFKKMRGKNKYDLYMPVIVALTESLKFPGLETGDASVVRAGTSDLMRELLNEIFRRVRDEHDYSYTPAVLVSAVNQAEQLGLLNKSETSLYLEEISKIYTFGLSVRNESSLNNEGNRFEFLTEKFMQKVQLSLQGMKYLPEKFEIPYIEGRVTMGGGQIGKIVVPHAFDTEVILDLKACSSNPVVKVVFSRFGAEYDAFRLHDMGGKAEVITEHDVLHTWTLSIHKTNGYIKGTKLGSSDKIGWVFNLPLQNNNPRAGGWTFTAGLPVDDGGFSQFTIEVLHMPE